jgi:hypothetical protein
LKARSVVIAVVLVLALACSLAYESCAQNPLRHSEADVRAWLLQKTPIGSTREQVMATIVREHWSGHREYRGTFRREIEHHPYFAHGAELGTYRVLSPLFIWPCHASAYWLFGANDRVTQVFVSKWCEGL